MTAPKTKYPIASFGPELMAFLIKSGREKVVLKFEGPRGYKEAHSFRRRIHTLRQRMREEKHPDYTIAARAKMSVFWGEAALEHGAPDEWREDFKGHRGALIVGRPFDSEFTEILKAAKVEVPKPRLPEIRPPMAEGGPVIPPPRSILDELAEDFNLDPPEAEK